MSELKRCPFCGGELEFTDDDYYWHPLKGCFLDATHVKNVEKRIKAWNTRKPVDDVVEALEKEKDGTTSWLEDMMFEIAIDKAIQIVKEIMV